MEVSTSLAAVNPAPDTTTFDNNTKNSNFRISLPDFDKLFPSPVEFDLPADILTDEAIALRSTRAFTRSQKHGTKSRIYNDSTSEEEDYYGHHKTRSSSSSFPTWQNKPYSSRLQEKYSLLHSNNNNRPHRKRTMQQKLNNRQIASFPERPPITEKWDAKSFAYTPFTKTVSPSVLMKGPFRLNARDIEQKFMQNCFSAHVAAIISAANYLDEREESGKGDGSSAVKGNGLN
ncbi:1196_t:CDS:1 [Ambispora gerdemannii]|uniref:1196_t:CDS:1 n=1 Tax=Ambispora gerdemannii TaxID=144530 RepID=A0A9N8V3L4_9GLOM|nr:1196_t:CDS:1 [Ambispora gerdemannii]